MQNTFYALPFTPSPLQVSAFLISASQAFTQCVWGGANKPPGVSCNSH